MPIEIKTGLRKQYTKEQDDFIKRTYANTKTEEIVQAICDSGYLVTATAVRSRAARLNVKKNDTVNRVVAPEGMYYCPKCKQNKDASLFYQRRPGTTSTQRNSYCIECTNNYSKEKRREKKYENMKKEIEKREEFKSIVHAEGKVNTCISCKETKPAYKFEINYRDRSLTNTCRECRREQAETRRLKKILEGKEW